MESSSQKAIPFESSLDLGPLKRFVLEQMLPKIADWDKNDEFPVDMLKKLHQLGYITAFVPQELGGMGVKTTDLAWVSRVISYASPGTGATLTANMLALVPLFRFAQSEIKQKVANAVLSGLSLASFCFTEPDAGSDVLRIKTVAERVPGGYRITGKKCFITNANFAQHFVVLAKTDITSQNPRGSISMFYVPAGTKGLTTGAPLKKLGHRESNTSEVFLDEVFIPEQNLIGKEGEGLKYAMFSLQRSRTMLAAGAAGVCDRARDVAQEFLASREHYGKALITQPVIRSQLAQLETEARASWFLTCAACAEWDANPTELQHSSMAKMFAGQVALKYTSAALELLGGWGYSREFEIERLFRAAKFYEIVEGPTFVQQVIIAKELFPEPKEQKSATVNPAKKAA